MKLIKKINPKHLFRSKANKPASSRTVSRSETEPSSFSSADTPTSVLPENAVGEWNYGEEEQVVITATTGGGDKVMSTDLVQAFKMMDKDGDGKITCQQLEPVLTRVGSQPATQEEVKSMLTEVDRDGDGCISLEEFSTISSAFALPTCDDELKDTFDFFDADHDGQITAEELRSVFAALGDERCTLEDCQRMINEVDEDGDGFVCFEEFARMMELPR